MGASLAFWLRAAGILLAAASIVSLLQHLFEIGLAPALEQIVGWWRNLLAPIFQWLHLPFVLLEIDLPVWFGDIHTLSFVLAAAAIRSSRWWSDEGRLRPRIVGTRSGIKGVRSSPYRPAAFHPDRARSLAIIDGVTAFLLGLFFVGLLAPILMLFSSGRRFRFLSECVAIAAVVLGFYSTNAVIS